MSADAIFTCEGDELVPSGHARGPWEEGSQHGGAPAALVVRAVERLEAPGPMLVARLTVEFLKAVPLAPLTVTAEVSRPGRRLQLAEATVCAEGEVVCRARAVRLRREPVDVPADINSLVRLAPPEEGRTSTFPAPAEGDQLGFHRTALDIRFVAGDYGIGPGAAWFRFAVPLVAGETPSAAQRAAAAADFGNGISRELDFTTHLFVNTDLTMHLAREPAGEWIGLDARTEHGPEGTALAHSTLHDLAGPVGLAAQSLYVAPR